MYPNEADASFFNTQKEDLKIWHELDPVDNEELIRTWAIAGFQQNKPNPFILDESLVIRSYFEDEIFFLGDLNGDGGLNVLDVVTLVSFILGNTIPDPVIETTA